MPMINTVTTVEAAAAITKKKKQVVSERKGFFISYLQHLSMTFSSARYLSQILDIIGHTYNPKNKSELT